MRRPLSRICRIELLIFCSAALLSAIAFATPFLEAQEPSATPSAAAPAAQTSQPEFKLRVEKNVVVVRVVVRDSKGGAVNGLRKEDFRITDNKKPQEIGGFLVETSEAAAVAVQPPAAATGARPGQGSVGAPAAPAPLSYLAFYFDDLYSAQDSLYRAGQAAEKFIAGLPASERVAIFTSSGFQTLDFTDDRQKIHESLMKLRASSRASPKGHCPEINDYLAYRITEVSDKDPAMGIIADEAVNVCHWPPLMATPDHLRALAYEAYEAYRFQSRVVLKNLESVIERVARMPGERQVMFVSDGLMDLEMNNRVESVVDRALRARVTVSALVGAGLNVNMVEMDTSRGYMPSPELSGLMTTYSQARETDAMGTLGEVAEGTGGQFFHDNNDLLSGLNKILLPPEVSYVLTFSPENLKADGAFHTLKVSLANGHGFTLQARKGYFAPKGQVNPEEFAKNEIREAVYSSLALQDLGLSFDAEVRKAEGENEDIAIQARLDVGNLPFEKKGDRNVDNVVFAVGLFDHDGKYVTGSQQTYALSLTDGTRAEMEKRGLALKTHVSAKTGAYNLRVVVRDAQGGKMAASSKAVDVPSQMSPPAAQQPTPPPAQQSAPPAAQQVVPPAQGVMCDTQGGKAAPSSKTAEDASLTAPPPLAKGAHRPVSDADFFEAYRLSDPITRWPLKKTKSQIPELNGIKPAEDQSQLPKILRGVSGNLQNFTANFVNIAATESVGQAERLRSPREGSLGWWGDANGVGQTAAQEVQKYRYLVMGRKEGEALTFVEYRTDLRGREEASKKQPKKFIKTSGFAAMPLFFGPFEQPWSDFRLLGQQTVGRDPTEVVAFAEHIEPVAVMGRFSIGEASIPILLQGVAWIRSSDYQILKMRMDLLGPLPNVALEQLTTVVLFARNQIQDIPTAFWLPHEVEVNVTMGPYRFSNRHTYSDYQLFRAESVIKPDTGVPEPR